MFKEVCACVCMGFHTEGRWRPQSKFMLHGCLGSDGFPHYSSPVSWNYLLHFGFCQVDGLLGLLCMCSNAVLYVCSAHCLLVFRQSDLRGLLVSPRYTSLHSLNLGKRTVKMKVLLVKMYKPLCDKPLFKPTTTLKQSVVKIKTWLHKRRKKVA